MELLERDLALDVLRRLLWQADEGRGSLLLLGGEAGVGKTTLLRRFLVEASSRARVLIGHCDALSTPRALGPLFDVGEPALNRLLDAGAPRDRIFQTLLARFNSRTRATLLAIEDAHWADEATLDLLRYLGRRIDSTHGFVVATYRDEEVGIRHPLRRVLGDLATTGAVQRVTLDPLTLQSVSALAEGSAIDPLELHTRTRGNPFFVTEILAAGGDIPPTVRDAVLARVSRLAPAAREVLEAAAVIGPPIATEVLQQVAVPTVDYLDVCLESGMLQYDGQTLAFRHELAREAILTAISPTRRTALHRDVVRALEGGPYHLYDPARLAHHAEEAGDTAAVLRHAPEAARRAAALRAHREAADQYARALRSSAAIPREEQARLLEARSQACYLTAQIDEAIAARTAALEIWVELGNQLKDGENRCYLAILHWSDARIGDADREATAALALLEALPPGPELAMAYRTLARLRGTILDDEDAITLGERAIELAEQFNATETLVDALITVGVARLARGNFQVGRAQLERSIQLATAAGLDDLTARAHANLGFGYDEHYQFNEAAIHYARGVQFCRERDLDNSRQHMAAWLARCRLFLGQWSEATELAESVLNARDIAPVTRFVALLVDGLMRTRRGQAEVWPALDEALDLAAASGSLYRVGPVRAARAEAAFLAGDRAAAVAEATAAYDLALTHGQRWYAGELAYWRWKGGDLEIDLANIAEPFALQIAGEWAAAAAMWDALGCPYEAARARAEGDEEAALRSALDTCEVLGALPLASAIRRTLQQRGARGIPRGPRPSTRSHPAGLTAREVNVLAVLAEGRSNQEIAERLFLSPRTVENHIAAILPKLGAANRAEASEAARRLGIIPQAE
jgi:DNA-binding CsgD family transcriptional regulator